MKFLSFLLLSGVMLAGCQQTATHNEQDQPDLETQKQPIIIVDSVDAPLPPEAKQVQTMPGKIEPQKLPNVDVSKPIVITKMPVTVEEPGSLK